MTADLDLFFRIEIKTNRRCNICDFEPSSPEHMKSHLDTHSSEEQLQFVVKTGKARGLNLCDECGELKEDGHVCRIDEEEMVNILKLRENLIARISGATSGPSRDCDIAELERIDWRIRAANMKVKATLEPTWYDEQRAAEKK